MTDDSLTLLPAESRQTIEAAVKSDPRLKSDHSKRQYLANLVEFETWRNDRPLTKTLVETYLSELQASEYAPASINQRLAAIRWWARKVSDLAADHTDDALAERIGRQAARILTVKVVRGERLPKGRYIPQTEFNRLLCACDRDRTPCGYRDAALIALAWSTGLRRDELAQLTPQDIRETQPGECTLIVHGKGDKDGEAYLTGGGYTRLRLWLDRYRGDDPGSLFCRVGKNRQVNPAGHLSGEALRKILEKRVLEAALDKPTTWHDFRRTFLSNIITDYDLAVAQQLGRHASSTTTAKYDRRPEELKRQAVRTTVNVPV